ncbi:hypothetical protein CC86DRAFT_406389 [Ophiobolus disseminans]|uniref:F-box domain-containing protein n=1 Tax=Ophiobolus disseminans TaxID=1469910 RepID=A0A6A6ZZZ8_9PLEO|nr:hypothetical protein CC86DRAFT_406389 [Ophiobolus disseminans]
MSSDLWHEVELPLQAFDTATLNALINPRSSILAHPRYLTVLPAEKTYELDDFQRRLLLTILTALPRDTLRGFTTNFLIDRMTFQSVIQTQRQLESFYVGLSKDLGDLTPMAPYLAAITETVVFVHWNGEESLVSCKNHHPLLANTLQLSSVKICLAPADHEPHQNIQYFADIHEISLGSVHGPPRQMDLEVLNLTELLLGSSYVRVTDHINISNLVNLEIDSSLKTFELHLTVGRNDQSSGTVHTVEKFLLFLSGLETLILAMSDVGIVSKDSIIKHAATLTCLEFDTVHGRPDIYELSDLTAILDSCKKLVELAVDLGIGPMTPWPGLWRDLLLDAKFEPTLPLIESHPSLQTLCMLDEPFIKWDANHDISHWNRSPLPDDLEEVAAMVMQNVANRVLEFLAQGRLKIRVFGYSLTHWILSECNRDSNGHCWPEYVYLKGKIIDGIGVEHVVGTPVVNVSQEISGASIFSGI